MRNHPDSVMIFAAGFGTRMGALTAERPKPLIEVGGKPLIEHALSLTTEFGARRVVANLHHKAEMLADYLAPRQVHLSREVPDILETGGGLRQALPLLGAGPVFTLNSDAVWAGPNPLTDLARAWDPDRMDALLMLIPPAQALGNTNAGDFHIGDDGRLVRGPGLIYAGAQIMTPDLLNDIPDKAFSLNQPWDTMLARRRLFGLIYDGKWCDVGRPDGIALAETLLESGDV